MCGRFSLRAPGPVLARQLHLPDVPVLAPRYNIAPTQEVAVVRQQEAGRTFAHMRWGLIPGWAGDPAIGARMINARAETVVEKPAFRVAFIRQRCLIPADGFYEWQRVDGQRQPFYIHLHREQPFAFVGLWESRRGADGTVIDSCTLLTTEANGVLRPIHARMSVILQPDDYVRRLDPELQQPDPLPALLQPYPEAEMSLYPVSTHVNRATNDDPQCIAPAA
jgi:putative SOS response-associated peptidase YedK